ncbi:MOSC domain-containing protein [Truncatella angustata]|uniref:MOSC domain-containing protein n=1 Tax=Truncatella angustata TaxID=152316 RepID=A0A9P8UWP2_9PEZI|nr:MOSC domain-containing protein [Truncatella angustata]KAH6659573.1 MOSC domain-containing protein [Truncatella angustata]
MMRITELYLYPIKALRPASITRSYINQQGFEHDRRFMLVKVEPDGGLKNVQTIHFPDCTRLFQEIDGDDVVVRYKAPEVPLIPATPEQSTALRVPLRPSTVGLQTIDITLMDSTGTAYRMADEYNKWFSACLGYEVVLVYLGDGKRPILAHTPPRPTMQKQGWLSTITSYVTSGQNSDMQEPDVEQDWLTFNEAAPLLITSEASLADVSARLPDDQNMDMKRFRPNIVVDGLEKWDEDFWGELVIGQSRHKLALTANCARCLSINIDYDTGRVANGEAGAVLKKLMKDRRVDTGNKWSPIFGRYAFLLDQNGADIAVGDNVTVTERIAQRDVWTWPKGSS